MREAFSGSYGYDNELLGRGLTEIMKDCLIVIVLISLCLITVVMVFYRKKRMTDDGNLRTLGMQSNAVFWSRNGEILAGIAVVLSDFIYFWLTKRIVSGDNNWAILIVSLAGGVGCALACLFSEKLSKDRTYVNVIMSDNLRAMQNFRDFLATHHITNVAADTYTLDWSKKTISITAYPETKAQSRLITEYIENSPLKFKRVVHKT